MVGKYLDLYLPPHQVSRLLNTPFKTCLFALLVQISISTQLTAQQARIDSLEALLPLLSESEEKVVVLNDLCFSYYPIDPNSGVEYGRQSLALATELKFDTGEVKALYYLSVNELSRSDFEKSVEFADNAIRRAEEVGYISAIYPCFNIVQLVYQKSGNYQKALEYSLLYKETSTKHNDEAHAALALSNIGNIYWELGDSTDAIKYYQDALDLMGEQNVDPINIGSVQSNLAAAWPNNDDKQVMLDDAIKFNKANGFINYLAYNYYYLGEYQKAYKSDLLKAIESLKSSIGYAIKTNDQFVEAKAVTRLGSIYLDLNEVDSAILYLESGQRLASTQNLLAEESEGLEKLAIIDFKQNRPSAAYNKLLRSNEIKNEIFNSNLAKQSALADAKYESEKKEAEIVRQELIIEQQIGQRKLLLVGGLLGLLLVATSFYAINQRTRRKKKESEIALKMERERNENLEELNRIKTDFFNNVSHELRTPLTMIIAPLKVALTRIKHVDIKRDLNFALLSSNRLLSLINEILDLSKLESGQEEINRSNINLHSFLSRVTGAFDSLATSQQIQLIKSFDLDEQLTVLTDPFKLEKICNNLISNAIKFTESGSVVEVEACVKDEELILAVMDQGPGVQESEMNRIFDRFYQAKDSNKSSGTGIGLSLVKELCQLLGGSITVQNGQENGSVFTAQIPVIIGQKPIETSKDHINPQFSYSKPKITLDFKPVILIVEDDMEMSKYLVSLFEKDFECKVAYNGEQAMEILKSQSIDMITSDIMMPGMDGFEFRDKVNSDGRWKSIPFIMLTARSLEQDRIKGLRLGVDDYITKPFSAEEIKARVENLLKNNEVRKVSMEEEPEAALDEKILETAKEYTLARIGDPNYKVEELAKDLNYSRRQMSRIMKRVTGLTPVEFLLEIRLQQAYRIINERRFGTIGEVRHQVGIESGSYFSKKFKERFGVSPGSLV